jgi:hypothetical protein
MVDDQVGYFIRWKGDVTGPFQKSEILVLWENGSINGFYEIFHEYSWVALSEVNIID